MRGQRPDPQPVSAGVGDRERAATRLGDRGAAVVDLDRRQRSRKVDDLLDVAELAGGQPPDSNGMRGLRMGGELAGPVPVQFGGQRVE